MESVDLTPIFNAIITLLALLVTVFLIPWIRSRTNHQQRIELEAWTLLAMQAAERLFVGRGRGEEKKAYVVKFLSERGFAINSKVVLNSIKTVIDAFMTDLRQNRTDKSEI